MTKSEPPTPSPKTSPIAQPRRTGTPLKRPALLLGVATVVMIIFIFIVGDARHRASALARVKGYAAELQRRIGSSSGLPLNLGLPTDLETQTEVHRFEWLTREQARSLRGSHKRVIAAYTKPVRRVLLHDGRGVVFFQDGRFETGWLSNEQFEQGMATQFAIPDDHTSPSDSSE